ncbi:MAG: type II secretion system protein GspM [Rhodobacteraceae bacterium]|jgi:hypothetical protein|nr:type II secretion system protein GspM [Paracoccaceae bacterium]
MIRPGSPQSRALALGIAAAAAALLTLGVVLPLAEWRARTLAAAEAARDEAERLASAIGRMRTERAQLSGSGIDAVVWPGERLGEVTARVQGRISELAVGHGLQLRSIAPTGTRPLPLTQGVGFRIESETTLDRLTEFLREVEHHAPALTVERATLRRLARPGEEPPQPVLFVQIDILAPVAAREDGT